jgi:ferric-dicitrate binding protein FerR (iron transport regulator)
LNVASVLRYKLNYGDTIRKVNLKGEGFFEIKKDPAKPFIVQTKHLDIEVLGTSFNVYAYDEEQIVETTVVTGKVKVKTHTSPALVAYLKPDEKALYHPQTGDLKIAKTDKRMETAWLKGALVFRSVPLKEILYKLERKYGVTIHLDNKRIEEDVFTGSFDSEYISDIMKILQKHYQFKYKIEGDHVYITSSPQNK